MIRVIAAIRTERKKVNALQPRRNRYIKKVVHLVQYNCYSPYEECNLCPPILQLVAVIFATNVTGLADASMEYMASCCPNCHNHHLMLLMLRSQAMLAGYSA